MQNKDKLSYFYIFLLSAFLAIFIFQFLYTCNNKYTNNSQQAINGLLYLDSSHISDSNIHYLINDWEYYQGYLLEPKDFKNGTPDIYTQYISIGEKTALGKNMPFGKSTYSITLSLPEKESIYALNMPEIYSAYNLYINNNLVLQSGDIYNYSPFVQNKTVVFKATGITRITIAVSDYTGLYSGMVYPPAFGSVDAINRLNSNNLFINTSILAISLIFFILSIFIALADKSNNAVIFSVLCSCSMIAVCYPLIHMFKGIKSPLWQGIELLSAYLIYLIILHLHNKICNINKTITNIVFVISAVMCSLAFFYGWLTPLHTVSLRMYCSYIIAFYKWAVVIYLLVTSFYSTYKCSFNIYAIVFGSTFFAISVAMDRIFPLYEPIYCGWFPEIGCFVMILCLGYISFVNIYKSYRMNIILETEKHQMEKRIEIQKESYNQITEQVNNTKKLRHDIKQHIRVMESFIMNGEYENLSNYLASYKSDFDVIKAELFCENSTINAILHYYYLYAKKLEIDFNVSITAYKDIPISDTDLSIIFGNLIENAIEACIRQTHSKKTINIYGIADENKLMFCIKNTFDGNVSEVNGKFLSSKRDAFGIGIESTKTTVKKYDGVVEINYNAIEFKVSVCIFY